MLDAGFGGGALFLADHADALAAEAAEAAHQRFVLAEFAVAGQRREFGDQRVDEIGEMRPLRMARHQRLLPRRQIGVEIVQRLRRLVLDPRDLLADVAAGRRQRAQFIDLGFEFGDGLFEIEIGAHVIRHQINIGTNARCRAKRIPVRVEKARIFNCLACNPTRGQSRVLLVAREALAGGNWLFRRAEGAEVKLARRDATSPPADAGRAPGSSAAPPPHGYRSGWSRCRCGRAASARCADRRRCAAGGWRRHGAAHAG